ncbi:MAG: signal peptidase II [Actinomycetota bacterium]|nr:signal peptidase II [Actinomycetota bacterium]
MTSSKYKPQLLGLVVAVIWTALDQISKSIAQATLSKGPHFFFGHVGFALVYNFGFAFSLASGKTIVVSLFEVGISIFVLYSLAKTTDLPMAIAYGLILGGAFGNIADRFFRNNHGGVIDFIYTGFWPTFNVADVGVVVGLILIFFLIRRPRRRGEVDSLKSNESPS